MTLVSIELGKKNRLKNHHFSICRIQFRVFLIPFKLQSHNIIREKLCKTISHKKTGAQNVDEIDY